MGAVRKTLSISTLGLVHFRSKKEQLARAEVALAQEHEAREVAEEQVEEARKEVRAARRCGRRERGVRRARGRSPVS